MVRWLKEEEREHAQVQLVQFQRNVGFGTECLDTPKTVPAHLYQPRHGVPGFEHKKCDDGSEGRLKMAMLRSGSKVGLSETSRMKFLSTFTLEKT